MNKKAAIIVSLSWIFMIIIGSFFLILTYNIIAKYKENEDAKLEIETKQALRNVLNNIGRTAGIEESSLQPVKNLFINSQIEILCQDGTIPIFSHNGKLDPNNEFIKNYPTFMTYIDQGKVEQTYIAVESLKLPFKITNLLAIVSQKNIIVLNKESQITQELLKKFQKGSYNSLNYITHDFTDLQTIESNLNSQNPNTIMFVSDYGKEINLNAFSVPSYHVQIKKESDQYGTIIFKDQKDNTKQFGYIDTAENLGIQTMAILSNPETFECAYNQIINSFTQTYNYYIKKTDNFIEKINQGNSLCSSSISEPEQQKIKYTLLKQELQKTKELIENEKTLTKEISTQINAIEKEANSLEQFDCLYIY